MSLGQIYKNALDVAFAGDEKPLYEVRHYADDFKKLWADDLQLETPLLLVWDDAPIANRDNSDELLLEKHLTPLDWALSWSLKCGREGRAIYPIVVIDLAAASRGDSWAWSVRHQLLADMPWLALTASAPVSIAGRRAHRWVILPDLTADGVLKKQDGAWKLTGSEAPASIEPRQRIALETLHSLWTASLNNSDEHHDINNVIGAPLLLEILGWTKRYPFSKPILIDAFLQRFAWHRAHAQSGRTETLPSHPLFDLTPLNRRAGHRRLSILTVDDKLSSGWDRVIAGFFNASIVPGFSGHTGTFTQFASNVTDRIDVYGNTSADRLISFLEVRDDNLAYRANFSIRDFNSTILNYENSEATQDEIIFLDLRLYGNVTETRTATARLITILKQSDRFSATKMAWPPISQVEVDRIERWVNDPSIVDPSIELDALLLLPRLLALASPLKPIMLFSSTERPIVRETLKGYGNIYTAFGKPNPLSNTQMAEDLRSISLFFEQAINLVSLNAGLSHIQRAIEIAAESRPLESERPDRNNDAYIYFEETGKLAEGISSAAAVLFITPEIKDRLDETLKTVLEDKYGKYISGWANIDNYGCLLYKSSQVTNGNIDKQMANLISILEANGVDKALRKNWSVISSRARAINVEHVTKKDGLSAFADETLDNVIKCNIEFVCFALLEYLGVNPNVHIALPTRVMVVSNGNNARKIEKSFQIELRGSGSNFRLSSYTHGTAFPLVRGWLQSWGKKYDALKSSVVEIRNNKLVGDYSDFLIQFRLNDALHNIADWAAATVSKPYFKSKMKDSGIFQRSFSVGKEPKNANDVDFLKLILSCFNESHNFGSTFNSNQLQRICENSIISTLDLRLIDNKSEELHMHRIVFWVLRDAFQCLSGRDLIQAARYQRSSISAEAGLGSSGSPRSAPNGHAAHDLTVPPGKSRSDRNRAELIAIIDRAYVPLKKDGREFADWSELVKHIVEPYKDKLRSVGFSRLGDFVRNSSDYVWEMRESKGLFVKLGDR